MANQKKIILTLMLVALLSVLFVSHNKSQTRIETIINSKQQTETTSKVITSTAVNESMRAIEPCPVTLVQDESHPGNVWKSINPCKLIIGNYGHMCECFDSSSGSSCDPYPCNIEWNPETHKFEKLFSNPTETKLEEKYLYLVEANVIVFDNNDGFVADAPSFWKTYEILNTLEKVSIPEDKIKF